MLVKSVLGGLGLGLLLAWVPALGSNSGLAPIAARPGPGSDSVWQGAAAPFTTTPFVGTNQKCACPDRRGPGQPQPPAPSLPATTIPATPVPPATGLPAETVPFFDTSSGALFPLAMAGSPAVSAGSARTLRCSEKVRLFRPACSVPED